MNKMLANKLSAPQRTVPAQRAFVQRPTPVSRSVERTQNSRDVRLRAGADDVGQSYANALLDLAQEQDVLEDIHNNVETLTALFKEDDGLKDFLTNPVISEEQKKEILDKVASEAKFSDYFVDFINILIDQDRLVSADAIFETFEKRYCQLTDTQVATIYSAVKLEQEQQFLVAKKLQELTGSKNIKLKTVIDESLIAGFTVDFGSAQIDLSVKGQLEEVASELVSGSGSLDLSGKAASSSNGANGGVSQEELIGDTDVKKEVEQELSKAKEAALA